LVIHEDGTAMRTPRQKAAGAEADDNASTTGMVSPPASPNQQPVGAGDDDDVPLSPGVPMIKISTESDRERELAELEKEQEWIREKAKQKAEEEAQKANGHVPLGSAPSPTVNGLERAADIELKKPRQAHASAEEEQEKTVDVPEGEGFSFANKRLCERWLDNLFMCLYEDLRIWTIFRAEVAHFKTQHLAYRKNSSEWEILGELGLRLHHKEEAKDAFQRCLDGKFSSKAWLRLLEMYSDEGDLQRALNAAIRLTVYNQRWYMETAYPTAVANHIYKLGQLHGHQKVSFSLLSMHLPEPIQKCMDAYLRYGKDFKVEGCEF